VNQRKGELAHYQLKGFNFLLEEEGNVFSPHSAPSTVTLFSNYPEAIALQRILSINT
jgi:hypothetical protein